ncbi:ankyrin repeat domain-containing protein 34B [Engraulis encrasicolus]|uniref:ankyrin repeat domain-containing protein 34B n=1 Tax=Engraulis encrasicolus TaxID=184585 RepID=UPI002FD2D589
MAEPRDYLSDGSPLITAAQLGKLRLVRVLLEGGAQVNEHNQRGETPLLAACKAMRGDQTCSPRLKLIHYLLMHGAEPNAQDKAGRTALMYACMERAGEEAASALIAAGADPTMEDYSGASALVYTINSHHQATLKVLLDACRAKGRDIIIIATDLSPDGGATTRRYLNVPPSPDTSPVSCMSPSDIELKTGSPTADGGNGGGNIFDFRGAVSSRRSSRGSSSSPRSPAGRLRSEPWLAIHNLAHLNRAYEEGLRRNTMQEEQEEEESYSDLRSVHVSPPGPDADTSVTTVRGVTERLPVGSGTHAGGGRRNTLPSLGLPPLLHLPSLTLNYYNSDSHLHNGVPSLQTESRPLSSASISRNLPAPPPPSAPSRCSKKSPLDLRTRLRTTTQARAGGFLPPLSPLPPGCLAAASGSAREVEETPEDSSRHCTEEPHSRSQPCQPWQRERGFSRRRHAAQLEGMGHKLVENAVEKAECAQGEIKVAQMLVEEVLQRALEIAQSSLGPTPGTLGCQSESNDDIKGGRDVCAGGAGECPRERTGFPELDPLHLPVSL